MNKDHLIEEMQHQLVEAEDQRQKQTEEIRKKQIEEVMNKANQPRKPYQPVKGDHVDELMAKYINECSFYVPVERLGEGTYLYGTKKIFAKIMNGKLIIRVGGGYMVIDEFLK